MQFIEPSKYKTVDEPRINLRIVLQDKPWTNRRKTAGTRVPLIPCALAALKSARPQRMKGGCYYFPPKSYKERGARDFTSATMRRAPAANVLSSKL